MWFIIFILVPNFKNTLAKNTILLSETKIYEIQYNKYIMLFIFKVTNINYVVHIFLLKPVGCVVI